MRKEILQKRNLNAKHFDNGNGSKTADFHLAHIHYLKDNKLENIDCQFLPTDYGWEMRKNNYELEIPRKANGWFKFINSFGYDSRGKERVDRPDEIVAIKPLGVESVAGVSIQRQEWKGKGIVLYKNAYGQDIDLEVMARNTGFVKEVVINKKPSNLSKDLEFAFEVDIGDLEVKPKKADYMKLRASKIKAFKGLEGKELLAKQKLYEDNLEREVWNKTSKLETSDSIILEKLRKTWFRKFNLYDSEGNQGSVKVRLENIEGKIILTKVLDKRFLENAVYPVRTDTTTSYYAGAGDGYIYKNEAGQPSSTTWNTAHDATTGNGASYTGIAGSQAKIEISGIGNLTHIRKAFVPCDTSGLGATAVVSAAILKVYPSFLYDDYNGTGYDYIAIVQTDQPNSAQLTTADYNNCGATDNPTKGSADIDISGLATGSYQDLTLNATGLGWIQLEGTTMLGIRTGQDIQDVFEGDPGENNKYSGIGYYNSEETDTSKDPYLSVTYTTPTNYTLTAVVGVFTLTGIASALLRGYTIAMSVGSFALTGISTTFTKALNLIAGVGSFTLTGIDVILKRALTMTASVGTFTLTGISVSLKKGLHIITSVGSFILTGITNTLTKEFLAEKGLTKGKQVAYPSGKDVPYQKGKSQSYPSGKIKY